jgi:hypothetical protein
MDAGCGPGKFFTGARVVLLLTLPGHDGHNQLGQKVTFPDMEAKVPLGASKNRSLSETGMGYDGTQGGQKPMKKCSRQCSCQCCLVTDAFR